jgi:hypothetical protein
LLSRCKEQNQRVVVISQYRYVHTNTQNIYLTVAYYQLIQIVGFFLLSLIFLVLVSMNSTSACLLSFCLHSDALDLLSFYMRSKSFCFHRIDESMPPEHIIETVNTYHESGCVRTSRSAPTQPSDATTTNGSSASSCNPAPMNEQDDELQTSFSVLLAGARAPIHSVGLNTGSGVASGILGPLVDATDTYIMYDGILDEGAENERFIEEVMRACVLRERTNDRPDNRPASVNIVR